MLRPNLRAWLRMWLSEFSVAAKTGHSSTRMVCWVRSLGSRSVLEQTPPDDWLRRRALGLAGKTAWVIPEPALRPSARNGFFLPVQQHAGVKEVMARSAH